MFLDTEAHCQEEGIRFIPMVIESSGGAWGPSARKVCNLIARASVPSTDEPHSPKAEAIAQCSSVILQRANAQAVLRRSRAADETDPEARGSTLETPELLNRCFLKILRNNET